MRTVGEITGKQSCALISIDTETMLGFRPDVMIISSQFGYAPLTKFLDELTDREISDQLVSLSEDMLEKSTEHLLIKMARIRRQCPRWVVLTPTTQCRYHRRNFRKHHGEIWRDYIYALTYVAFELASEKHADIVGITHLADSGFAPPCKFAMAEAIGHFFDERRTSISNIVFTGCCVRVPDLESFAELNQEGATTRHRAIATRRREAGGIIEVEVCLRTRTKWRC